MFRSSAKCLRLPEIELSPVRHFIVTKNAGGWALGAYDGERMVGFVLSVPAFLRDEPAFYSHMTGVRPEYQSYGIGARLKWEQRLRALHEGVQVYQMDISTRAGAKRLFQPGKTWSDRERIPG